MPLIISPNLIVVGPEADFPDGTPLILWDNAVTNVVASSESGSFIDNNLLNPATNLEWRAAAIGAVELEVTTGAIEIDGVGIAKHNFGSAGISVEIGKYVAAVWNSLTDPVIPATDEPLLFHFTKQAFNSDELVVKLGAGTAAARAAVLYAGPLLIMERSIDIAADFATPRFARRTEFVAPLSDRGDYLGRIVTSQFLQFEHTYSYLRANWYRDNMEPFIAAAQQDVPFFYCFDPDGFPFEVSYAWLTDDAIPLTNPPTGRKRVVMRMGGIVS